MRRQNTEVLWIRVCKSFDPSTRLRSVYRRFYLKQTDKKQIDTALINILSGIVDKYCEVKISSLVESLNPDSFINKTCFPDLSYSDRVLDELIKIIRYSESTTFDSDFPWPIRQKR